MELLLPFSVSKTLLSQENIVQYLRLLTLTLAASSLSAVIGTLPSPSTGMGAGPCPPPRPMQPGPPRALAGPPDPQSLWPPRAPAAWACCAGKKGEPTKGAITDFQSCFGLKLTELLFLPRIPDTEAQGPLTDGWSLGAEEGPDPTDSISKRLSP